MKRIDPKTIGKSEEDRASIVRMYDVFSVGGQYSCIIMSTYKDAVDMYDFLFKKSVDSRMEALYVLVPQIMRGLQYLQKLSIAHRDIKLDNIIVGTVNNELKAMIIDFDRAIQFDNPVGQHKRVGTVGHFSPELYLPGQSNLLHNEIWAFGVLLYAGIYQEFPYGVTTTGELKRLSSNSASIQMLKVLNGGEHTFVERMIPQNSITPVNFAKYNKLRALLHQLLTIDPTKRKTAQDFPLPLFQ
ncbi:kinase-like domain-containing protein [Syncephalis plumigaleata]|nr:kinase-like domain-containing protein [Syncephalis plumigaleata]